MQFKYLQLHNYVMKSCLFYRIECLRIMNKDSSLYAFTAALDIIRICFDRRDYLDVKELLA